MARVTNEQIMERLDDLYQEVREMNGRQREDHDEITRLKEQLSTMAKAQAAFTSVAAVFAAWLGLNR